MNYKEFKSEILTRARSASACEAQYKRAYEAKDFAALFAVIKDNFVYCCNNGIIDAPLLEQVREDADKCDVWLNVNASSGFLLAYGSATVKAYGSAYINVRSDMECKISENAIMRYRDTNEVITTSSMQHRTI